MILCPKSKTKPQHITRDVHSSSSSSSSSTVRTSPTPTQKQEVKLHDVPQFPQLLDSHEGREARGNAHITCVDHCAHLWKNEQQTLQKDAKNAAGVHKARGGDACIIRCATVLRRNLVFEAFLMKKKKKKKEKMCMQRKSQINEQKKKKSSFVQQQQKKTVLLQQ